MGHTIAYTLLALLGGVFVALQAPTNAMLAKGLGSPLLATLVSFAVGMAALLLVLLANGLPRPIPSVKPLPWYVWIGGFYGAYFVVMAAFVTPRIGVGALLTASVAGQLVGAIILDHYGFFGMEPRPATFVRVFGVGLVFVGAWLVRRG